MIAHVVFDLPLEEHFDYLIPKEFTDKVILGVRVKVLLGLKPMTGYVVSVAEEAMVSKVKPLKAVCDSQPVFDERDLRYARVFANYYGCSLGEALAVMMRQKAFKLAPATTRQRDTTAACPVKKFEPTSTILYHCSDGKYLPVIAELVQKRDDYFIIVPDSFTANALMLPVAMRPHVGLRSSMFKAFAYSPLIMMIDEEHSSYKQEQSPMYEARQALLMAQKVYGFNIAFISATPSIELMQMVGEKIVEYKVCHEKPRSKPAIIDTGNYKYLEKGILSPAARHSIEQNIAQKGQTLIILNRRGTYNITQCSECGYILKCEHCDSAMSYSRAHKQFVCRHCTYSVDAVTNCPQCHKTSWKSFGMGIEQLQKELAQLFPEAITAHYEKDSAQLPKEFDILIATSAVLHCKGQIYVRTVLLVDLDAELNRLDMRSSFKGWALVQHSRLLGEQILIQTRNPNHHAVNALAMDDAALFYKEELRLRQELGFAPFRHWAAVIVRAKVEKSAQTCAQDMYNAMIKYKPQGMDVSSPQPDVPAKLRDQYRFRVSVQGQIVEPMIQLIKRAMANIKRSKAIITINIDP